MNICSSFVLAQLNIRHGDTCNTLYDSAEGEICQASLDCGQCVDEEGLKCKVRGMSTLNIIIVMLIDHSHHYYMYSHRFPHA